MSADPSIGQPTDLGKGLFGYRKSDVAQLLSDRDLMLQEAEKRFRASEARVAQLEGELTEANGRVGRLEEQLGRLRQQFDAMVAHKNQVEQLAGQVQAEAQRIVAWRKRGHEVARAVKPSVDQFRVLLEELPGKVEATLAPVAARIPSLTGMLEEFAQVADPPARHSR